MAAGLHHLSPNRMQAAASGEDRLRRRDAFWQRNGRNLLYGFHNMYNFRVLYEPGKNYPFRAWFFGWAVKDCNQQLPGFKGCDAIFAARARSLGGPWEVYTGNGLWDKTMSPSKWQPVIIPQDRYYDQWHNGDPSVVKIGRRYYMAYSSTGFNKDGVPQEQPGDLDGDFLCIMGAVSEDGLHWQRSQSPILARKEDYGAKPVTGGVHAFGSYHRPSLLYEEGKFRLWFDYYVPGAGISMGYAENSGDFLKPEDWKIVRAGNAPLLPEWPNPNVVRVGKTYYSYADPGVCDHHPWTCRKISEAVSSDGIHWQILGYLEPDPDTPAIHVPEAFVHREGKTTWIYLLYACQVGGEPYNWRYNRIRYMRRDVMEDKISP
jgi:hypothetical protein